MTERGGATSHAAILARSFGIPAVVGVPRLLESVGEGDRLVVDGRDGVVWREPSEDVLAPLPGPAGTRKRGARSP